MIRSRFMRILAIVLTTVRIVILDFVILFFMGSVVHFLFKLNPQIFGSFIAVFSLFISISSINIALLAMGSMDISKIIRSGDSDTKFRVGLSTILSDILLIGVGMFIVIIIVGGWLFG
jgi:hypothetical protein